MDKPSVASDLPLPKGVSVSGRNSSGMIKSLPNGDHPSRSRQACGLLLDPEHPRGRHKARIFRDALGMGRADAADLRARFLNAAEREEATLLSSDAWGARWQVDVAISRHDRRAVVRTIWIVRTGELNPRFITCWVL
jgi:hypothetical protein